MHPDTLNRDEKVLLRTDSRLPSNNHTPISRWSYGYEISYEWDMLGSSTWTSPPGPNGPFDTFKAREIFVFLTGSDKNMQCCKPSNSVI